MVLFLWGRWRHDLVALASLLACTVLGLVSADKVVMTVDAIEKIQEWLG